MRRKTLRNNLKKIIDSNQIEDLGIDSSLRAENLTVEEFVSISNSIQ
jgi:16S rRNA (adenine1518-N6/adenine1519-N6)-dimethyltransferase